MFNTIKAKVRIAVNKIRANKIVKKLAVPVMAALTVVTTAINSFAAETGSTVSPDTVDTVVSGVTGVFSSLTTVFNFANIIKFVGIGIVACAAIVLGYIGVRKLVAMIKSAMAGKLKGI